MNVQRVWLPWKLPCLQAAADWLIAQFADAQVPDALTCCDLSNFVCVVPGRRAGRLLLAQLVRMSERRLIHLIPPRIITPGALPDLFQGQSVPIASASECQWAWMKAVTALPSGDRQLLQPAAANEDLIELHQIAAMTCKLHEELAGALRSFSDAQELAAQLDFPSEARRWAILNHTRTQYLRVLQENGLADPHEVRMRSMHDHPPSHLHVLLIGVPELSPLQRVAAARLASEAALSALIHAPSEMQDAFDELGCVSIASWEAAKLDIRKDQLMVADRPGDQAQSALNAIAQLCGQFSPAQITIGLGDEGLAPAMQHAAQWAGLSARSAAGASLVHSPPCRALEVIAQWLSPDGGRFSHIAAMMRHPDIESHIRREASGESQNGAGVSNWLTLLDEYFADHLHARIGANAQWLGDPAVARKLAAAHDALMRLIKPLQPERNVERTLGEWAGAILQVLRALYEPALASSAFDAAQKSNINACAALRQALAEWAGASAKLQPKATASQAITILLASVASERLAEEFDESDIEMLGWLELHLDPAPVLIILGVNEGGGSGAGGGIPQSISADAFLPDSFRAKLGLACNRSRYARDAYLMQAILRSRDIVKLIAGRHSVRDDPLGPSRLLAACDDETLQQRIRLLCGNGAPPPGSAAPISRAPIGLHASSRSRFVVPPLPLPLPVPQHMAITDFRAYLQCPYRYALSRLLRLNAFSDDLAQLDPLQFGTIAHEALCTFGSDENLRTCSDAEKIDRCLQNALEQQVAARFGSSLLPAVAVQIARLQQRLRSFAKQQAQIIQEGWRTLFCELKFDSKSNFVHLDIPGDSSMPLHGKIDRIDIHSSTNAWRIIDYKTSEEARSPRKTHHSSESLPDVENIEWIDLQLPLYHYLITHASDDSPIRTLPEPSSIELGYMCLPARAEGACLKLALWTDQHIESAINKARQIVQDVRQQKFELNPDFNGTHDDFARICHSAAHRDVDLQLQLQEGEA